MLRYDEAYERVVSLVSRHRTLPRREIVSLEHSLGRVLAEQITADRDSPPFDRATRDGFAVRAADVAQVPATLKLVGEVKPGESFSGSVGTCECIRIMTGASIPAGADAVVMIENSEKKGELVRVKLSVRPGDNVVMQGSEARKGAGLLELGHHIGYGELSLLAQVGKIEVEVYRRPRVAILTTGDEVVEVATQPSPVQIRNSNICSLAAQVTLSGGEPVLLGNVPDDPDALREKITRGMEEDLLVVSGGVSVGRYDLVKEVLRGLNAEFFFDAVAMQPGRPTVFARCGERFVLGLPGNPVSTIVAFEVFAAPAIRLLAGGRAEPLRFLKAKLSQPVRVVPGLTRFLPARLEGAADEVTVRAVPWQGGGDVVALTKSDCFLVVPETQAELTAGSWVNVLLRQG